MKIKTQKDHKNRHIKLDKYLDELIGDYILGTGKSLKESSILDLMEWSHNQTINPDKY